MCEGPQYGFLRRGRNGQLQEGLLFLLSGGTDNPVEKTTRSGTHKVVLWLSYSPIGSVGILASPRPLWSAQVWKHYAARWLDGCWDKEARRRSVPLRLAHYKLRSKVSVEVISHMHAEAT